MTMQSFFVVVALGLVAVQGKTLVEESPKSAYEKDSRLARVAPNTTVQGQIYKPQIIGGSNATPGEFPYQVSVQVLIGGAWSHQCGGAVLSTTKIATAAHCCTNGATGVEFPAASLQIVAGAHNILTSETTQQISKVSRLTRHAKFTVTPVGSVTFDVCKIFLSTPLTLNVRVAAVPLCTTEPAVGATCTATGWGSTVSSGIVTPTQLQKLNVNVVSRATCAAGVPFPVNMDVFCAGGVKGQATCVADSGGPLVCNKCLAGVVSFGPNPCGQPFPSFLANVANAEINSFFNSN